MRDGRRFAWKMKDCIGRLVLKGCIGEAVTLLVYEGHSPEDVVLFGRDLEVEPASDRARAAIRSAVARVRWGSGSGATLFLDEPPLKITSRELLLRRQTQTEGVTP